MKRNLTALIALASLLCQQTAHAQCTADAGPQFVLTCATSTAMLQGASNAPNATYSWSGPGGFTSTQANPVATTPGVYSLTITDPSNGCTATDQTLVLADLAQPVASIAGGTLSCTTPVIPLTLSVSPTNCVYLWIGPNGFTTFQQNPTVSFPGVYTVTVTNPVNGCTTVQNIVVDQDIAIPSLSASADSISCINPTVSLAASSSTPGVTFHWTGPGGFQSNLQNPTANSPGTYTVVVTAPNGCTNSAMVQVAYDSSFPQAEFAPVTSSCNDNGAITCLNPNPQYRFLWGSGDTTASRTNLASGVYSLTVTDLLTGCARGYTFVVPQLQQALVGDSRTNPFCEFKNGSITLSPIPPSAQISYAWTGPNGFSSNLAAINGLDSGTYIVTLTNLNSGCSQVNTYKLVRTGPPVSSMWISEALCDNVLAIETAGGGFTFDWGAGPTPGTGPVTELALPPGTYAITLTSGSGCTGMKTVVIPPNSPPCTYVFGKVRLDEAQNCQTNFDEPGLFAWFLTAESATDTFFARTDTAGNYRMRAVPGNYTVHLVQQGFQPFVCQNDVPVSLLQAGDSVQTDFLVQVPNAACPDLSIQLTAPVLRRCFSNNFYYLHYCNQSPLEVPDAYFTLKLDPLLGLQDAAIPFTDLGNNQYQFQLGTLPPNFCGDVWVRILVSCSAVLGQTLCSEANIYPDSLCVPPPPQWSGAHLEVRSECLGDSLFFIFKNIGSGAMPGLLDYIVIEDGIMSRQGSAAPLQAGQTMTVGLPATGATWRIEAPQVAFSPRPDQPWLSVEGCTSSGSFSTGFVNQFPLGASGQQTDVDCTVVTGAYDPNDKQGFPEGYGPAGYIRPGTELEYLIRFQNTGTDTAFAVVIRDTLSPWLDPLSVRPGASSHSYRFELTGSGILIFDFQDILLPDSNVNEAASHGFVRFNISPRVDVPLETDVLNRAAIYFDFNQPVLTNTTWHRIGINFVSVGLWQPGQAAYQVRIAPHPLRDASWLALDLPAGTSSSGEFRLEIFNAPGSRVAQEQAPEPRFLLRKNQLAAGVYGFTVSAGGKILGAGKLVVQ